MSTYNGLNEQIKQFDLTSGRFAEYDRLIGTRNTLQMLIDEDQPLKAYLDARGKLLKAVKERMLDTAWQFKKELPVGDPYRRDRLGSTTAGEQLRTVMGAAAPEEPVQKLGFENSEDWRNYLAV